MTRPTTATRPNRGADIENGGRNPGYKDKGLPPSLATLEAEKRSDSPDVFRVFGKFPLFLMTWLDIVVHLTLLAVCRFVFVFVLSTFVRELSFPPKYFPTGLLF